MVRLSHFNCHNDPYLPSDNSPSDDEHHVGGKDTVVASPPNLAKPQDGAHSQPVNEKKLKRAMETRGRSRLVKNKTPKVSDPNVNGTCLIDAILSILPKHGHMRHTLIPVQGPFTA